VQFKKLLMEAVKIRTTAKKNANVLMHMAGYFKKLISSAEKAELWDIIDQYRRNTVPLIVPITLISHYVRKHDQPYLRERYYLNPHPGELKLRNHAQHCDEAAFPAIPPDTKGTPKSAA
jgi:uncharacterized protein YbgA (DUF1722 family)